MRKLIAVLALLAATLWSAPPANATTYGWRWNQVVGVYDGTSAGNTFNIPQSVSQWGSISAGLQMRMVSDPTQANIVVREVDTMTNCSASAIGCATGPSVAGGVAYGVCNVDLARYIDHQGYAVEVALHELGHCVGLDHSPDGVRSVMRVYGTTTTSYFTKPQPYDRRDIRTLYR